MRSTRLPTLTLLLATVLLAAGCASTSSADRAAAVVANPERSAADRTNDVRRKPAEMLTFIGIQPGWTALDVSASRGYTTELIARSVGPQGKVFAQTQAPTSAFLADRARNPATPNIVPVVRPFNDPVPPEVANGSLDLVTLMFNYHDFGSMGVDRGRLNRAIFDALKRGGSYVIADHSGRPGTGISESGSLHRVEEAFVIAEVQAAGFRLAASGNFLRNPADPRDRETPQPPMPKDEFVLKFVKP